MRIICEQVCGGLDIAANNCFLLFNWKVVFISPPNESSGSEVPSAEGAEVTMCKLQV